MKTEGTTTSGWLQESFVRTVFQPEKPSLARVAVFLMGLPNHDGYRKRSNMERNPHKAHLLSEMIASHYFTVALVPSAPFG